jgi:hypothetical protein
MAYTYNEAKKEIYKKRILGVAIVSLSSLSTVVSVLKMFYFSLDGGDQLSHAFAQPIKRLVELVYKNTHFLEYFWSYSPTPSPKLLLNIQNSYFLAGYVMIFFGIGFLTSAKALSARLAAIDKHVEDEMIKASVTGNRIRQREEIQDSIPVKKPDYFAQFQSLYFAPIIAGVIVAAITKFMGLT